MATDTKLSTLRLNYVDSKSTYDAMRQQGLVESGEIYMVKDETEYLATSKVKTAQSSVSGDVYDVTYINTMIGDIETLLQALR